MTRFALAALAGMVTIGMASQALAEGMPGTLKGDLPPVLYNRVVKPIEAKLALVERAMKPYEKEMEKPPDKRNKALLASCKEKAATAYHQAALAAEKSAKMVKNEEHKAAIKQQYEDPNRRKAIDILLELAMAAQQKGDIRRAIALYQRILGIEQDNPQAKGALTRIARDIKNTVDKARKDQKKKKDRDKDKSWK